MICSLYLSLLKTSANCCTVSFSFLPRTHQEELMGYIRGEFSSYRGKFDQGKLTFELAGNSSHPSKNPREMGLYLS